MPRGNRSGSFGRGQQCGGRMGGNQPGSGPCGECVCSACGEHIPHQVGTPCYSMSCPKCGTKMTKG